MRALAILFVLISHSGVRHIFGLELGFVGVEIFFVLSGFLIGQILLDPKTGLSNRKELFSFYLNRWLRTLPLYFLVLIVKDCIDPEPAHWKFYLFLQLPEDFTFFAVSWSLVIEEWFYLLIPLLLLFNKKIIRLSTFRFLLLLVFLFWLARVITALTQQTVFDMEIRKTWFLRFDALIIGVILSHVKLYKQQVYTLAKGRVTILFSAILFFLAFVLYYFFVRHEAEVSNTFIKALGQSSSLLLFSCSIALFIAWIEQNDWINRITYKPACWFITAFALLAYPIYLVHFDFFLMIPYTQGYTNEWLLHAGIFWFVSISIAALLHFAIEKPVMIRRKWIIDKILR